MRGVNRVVSGVLGLILIVLGLITTVAAIIIWAGRRPRVLPLDRWYSTLRTTPLSDRGVLITALVIGVVGLLILLSQLLPWAPDRVLIGTPAASEAPPPGGGGAPPGGDGAVKTRESRTESSGEAGTRSAEASAASLGTVPDEPVMVVRGAAPGEVEAAPWWVTRRSVQRRTATAAGAI